MGGGQQASLYTPPPPSTRLNMSMHARFLGRACVCLLFPLVVALSEGSVAPPEAANGPSPPASSGPAAGAAGPGPAAAAKPPHALRVAAGVGVYAPACIAVIVKVCGGRVGVGVHLRNSTTHR